MKKITNMICTGLGFLFLGIGAVGVVLPILPTTPFLLLAAFLFARGSEKFHHWFTQTSLYQKYLNSAVTNREMTADAKRKLLTTVSLLLAAGFAFSPVWYARVLIVLVAVGHYYYFLCRIKTVENQEQKREQERQVMTVMVEIYCHGMHGTRGKDLCPECEQLKEYACYRIEKCPFMETKTFCSACKVHCYSKEMREQIKLVMRYAGPRMLLVHPLMALHHCVITVKKKVQSRGEKNVS